MKTNIQELKVSIIIPTLNSAKTIRQCLQSIQKQTFNQIEVIVVDALSSDDTVKIAESFQAKVLQVKGLQSQARNIGIKASSGKFILFLDSDQALSIKVINDCLNKCLHESAGMVRVPEVFVGDGFWSECSAIWRNNYDRVEALYGGRLGLVHGQPRFFARQHLMDAGLFDATLLWGEDYDLYERLKELGVKEAFCNAVLYHFEVVSLRQFLLKNLRYGDSMSTFRRQSGGQGFSPMINHALLTFVQILKKPQRLSWVAGCAVLFFIKSTATVLGILGSR
jgi:glycosyltransferase involved in cell wall biosynthesis